MGKYLIADFANKNNQVPKEPKKTVEEKSTVTIDPTNNTLSLDRYRYEKLKQGESEKDYRERRLKAAALREQRLQREDKRKPLQDLRRNINTVTSVSKEGRSWWNFFNKLKGGEPNYGQ